MKRIDLMKKGPAMRLTIIIIFALLLFSFPIVQADTINIPADYPTIQEGIDAALNGDTVLVAPGTYEENIWFNGKAIIVKSASGPAVTELNGGNPTKEGSSCTVGFNMHEGPDSVLEGFTITKGTGWEDMSGWTYGGGIYIYIAKPTIKNNIITDNVARFGGGIYCCGGMHTNIVNNIIEGNHAYSNGGGISSDSSYADITNCIISGNSAMYGGGIDLIGNGSATVTNCIITMNSATEGAGIFSTICGMEIVNNTIVNNTATETGGGVTLIAFVIAEITNTILWSNSAPEGPEIFIGCGTWYSTLDIRFSDVEGGQNSVYVDPGNTLIWGSGMIEDDPLFLDATNSDFHLTYTSPCCDTGDNSVVTEPFDFEGDPRIAWGGNRGHGCRRVLYASIYHG